MSDQAQIQAPDGWSAHLAALYRLGLPLIGAQMAQMAIHLTDIAMVGRLGAPELAATALATNYFFLIYIFGSGFLVALSPIIAQMVGSGDTRAVRRSTRMGMWFAIAYGIACLPLLLVAEPVLVALGQDAKLAAIAGEYMAVASFGMVPSLIFIAYRSFLGAINRASILLWASLAAVVLNAALCWVLIFGRLGMPALGVRGAGFAAIGTNLFLVAIISLYITRDAKASAFDIFARFWRADWLVMRSLLALGLPISLTIVAEVGLFQVATLMAGWLGVVALAAHSIVMQLISFAFMVPLGLASAATIRVGQSVGAGRLADAGRAARGALLTAVAVSMLTIILFVALPAPLIRIFLAADDPLFTPTLAAAVPLLMIAAAFNLFDGAQAIGAGNLRGLKDTRVPMLIAIGAYWGVGVPLAYVCGFTFGLGTPGLWAGLAGGLLVAGGLLNWRFFARLAAMAAPRPQLNPAS